MDISAYQHMNIRMSTRGKRPLRNLTPSDKVRAIQRIHNGETKASVSRDIGVPESTLRGWCKNEQKLRFMCRQLGMEQMPPIDALENPPEKRIKFENHIVASDFTNIPASFEDFGYNRLSLNSVDFVTPNNNNVSNNSNGILEKIAFSEFIKKNNFAAAEASKPFGSSRVHLPGLTALPTDYSQLSMIQNLNLLSLLNPNLAAMPLGLNLNTGSCSLLDNSGTSRAKVPLRTSNSADETRDNTKNNTSPALSVKNWAKDTSENMSTHNGGSSSINKHNMNDSNNNDLEPNLLLSPVAFPETAAFPLSLFPSGLLELALAQISPASTDSESSQAALLEWCKVFNASLNYLALAAAAAALQSPPTTQTTVKLTNENSAKTEPVENILYKQLTQMPATSNSSSNTMYMQHSSDVSNDSYFDSEPEDLSVRSITSKLSSSTNSRSHSPAKSTASTFSTHSDTEP